MRVVAITQIWPNAQEPLSSPFNVQQFKALKTRCDLTVLAAVPYFPGAKITGQPPRPALVASLPDRDVIAGIDTRYVRQLYVPKVGVPIAVPLYLASLAPYVNVVRACDVVLATWAYPDGCAATLLARALGKPCVVKVHGSDVNLVAKIASARAVLKRVLPRADALVSVSRALSRELEGLGVDDAKITLVANGVDTTLFTPRSKTDARASLAVANAKGPIVVFVGRLEPQKGLGDLFAAWKIVANARPDATLVLVGEVRDQAAVLAAKSAFGASLVIAGARPLREVADWIAACDVFTLPSWAEGTPNVVLEALASGRPVVATTVGGIPDVLADPRSGILVPPRDPASLARGLLDALARAWNPEDVRACGPSSWDESAAKLFAVLERVARS